LYGQLRACSGGVYGRAFLDFRKMFGDGARFYLEKILIQYAEGTIIGMTLTGCEPSKRPQSLRPFLLGEIAQRLGVCGIANSEKVRLPRPSRFSRGGHDADCSAVLEFSGYRH
jgi:hypothetical protein